MDDGEFSDHRIRELPELLRSGDALVFNDTRVIPARLRGQRGTRKVGATTAVEFQAILHTRIAPDRWTAFAKPGRRLRVGDVLYFSPPVDDPSAPGLSATIEEKLSDGELSLKFNRAGTSLDTSISSYGNVPLPPYIEDRRRADDRDREDYQTLYAKNDGSVAAPTAGLHFTPRLLASLTRRGISQHFLTLHIGAGTFLPVRSKNIAEHRMHAEYGEISEAEANALNAVRQRGGRIVCVGTTALRLLECATEESGLLLPFRGYTEIFIRPGYRFRFVDGLLTNFHLPRSSLFILISAFIGTATAQSAYAYAIRSGYRFYSYGDASLLMR